MYNVIVTYEERFLYINNTSIIVYNKCSTNGIWNYLVVLPCLLLFAVQVF